MKTLVRITAILALAAGTLVACGSDEPACAGTAPKPGGSNQYKPPKPAQPRYTYKAPKQDRPQDKPKPTQPRVTSWKNYQPPHRWGQSYRPKYPPAPQPTVAYWHGDYYRIYPDYPGYYRPGTWPIGYGHKFGCEADREDEPVR